MTKGQVRGHLDLREHHVVVASFVWFAVLLVLEVVLEVGLLWMALNLFRAGGLRSAHGHLSGFFPLLLAEANLIPFILSHPVTVFVPAPVQTMVCWSALGLTVATVAILVGVRLSPR
jgi:hypothetical protein